MLSFRTRHPVLLAAVALVLASQATAAEVRGVLVDVDLAKHELRVEGRGRTRGTLTLTLDDKTLVLFGSQKAAAADLQAGRRIRIEYEEDDNGARVARVVHASGRPASAAAKPAPATAAPALAGAPADAVQGVLQRVAQSDREVVVIGPGAKGPETETTVAVPESAKIVKEGKPATLAALKEGDAVAIRVQRDGNRLTALEVQAGPGAALAAAPAAERSRIVPRLRQALHLADEVLRYMDSDSTSGKKP